MDDRQYTDQLASWPGQYFYRCLILIKLAAAAGGSRWVIAGWRCRTVTIGLFTALRRAAPGRAGVRFRSGAVCVWRRCRSVVCMPLQWQRCKTDEITTISIIIIIIITSQHHQQYNVVGALFVLFKLVQNSPICCILFFSGSKWPGSDTRYKSLEIAQLFCFLLIWHLALQIILIQKCRQNRSLGPFYTNRNKNTSERAAQSDSTLHWRWVHPHKTKQKPFHKTQKMSWQHDGEQLIYKRSSAVLKRELKVLLSVCLQFADRDQSSNCRLSWSQLNFCNFYPQRHGFKTVSKLIFRLYYFYRYLWRRRT